MAIIKKALTLLLCAGLFFSCTKKSSKKRLAGSEGIINTVNVVVDKEQWQGLVGDAMRKVLATPVDGLPREEPSFSIKQTEPELFTGFAKRSRILLKLERGDTGIRVDKNLYASPQTAITILGNTDLEQAQTILRNSDTIIASFQKEELLENQRRIKVSLKNSDSLQNAFGVRLKFPSAYRYAKQNKDFFWMRKDLKRNGNMNITVYEVPLNTLDRDTFTIARIVRMRDSVAGKNIPVEKGRFQTERAFSPYLFKTQIDGHFAWETKGTWDVTEQWMAGPFLNYAIKDEKNDRYLILEGFIHSPAQDQRDNMFELESILRSAKLD